MQVWLNGAFTDDTAATVGVFDAAVQHAVGIFETIDPNNPNNPRPKRRKCTTCQGVGVRRGIYFK